MLLKVTPLKNNSWLYTPEDNTKGPILLNTKDIVYLARLTDQAIAVRSFAPAQPEVSREQRIEQLEAMLSPLDRFEKQYGIKLTEANRGGYEAASRWRMSFGTNHAARTALTDFRIAGGISIAKARQELAGIAAAKTIEPEVLTIRGSFRDIVRQLGTSPTPFIELHQPANSAQTIPLLFNTNHISTVTQGAVHAAKPGSVVHFSRVSGPETVNAYQFSEMFAQFSHSSVQVVQCLDEIVHKTKLSVSGHVQLTPLTNTHDIARASHQHHMAKPH